MSWRLDELRALADVQFGKGVGEILFPNRTVVKKSAKTGRTRYAFVDGELVASVRTSDGHLTLTARGAKTAYSSGKLVSYVVVNKEGEVACLQGKDIPARSVVEVGDILAGDEVVVVGSKGVIGIGRALLSGEEMLRFDKGVAVKVRKHIDEEAPP